MSKGSIFSWSDAVNGQKDLTGAKAFRESIVSPNEETDANSSASSGSGGSVFDNYMSAFSDYGSSGSVEDVAKSHGLNTDTNGFSGATASDTGGIVLDAKTYGEAPTIETRSYGEMFTGMLGSLFESANADHKSVYGAASAAPAQTGMQAFMGIGGNNTTGGFGSSAPSARTDLFGNAIESRGGRDYVEDGGRRYELDFAGNRIEVDGADNRIISSMDSGAYSMAMSSSNDGLGGFYGHCVPDASTSMFGIAPVGWGMTPATDNNAASNFYGHCAPDASTSTFGIAPAGWGTATDNNAASNFYGHCAPDASTSTFGTAPAGWGNPSSSEAASAWFHSTESTQTASASNNSDWWGGGASAAAADAAKREQELAAFYGRGSGDNIG